MYNNIHLWRNSTITLNKALDARVHVAGVQYPRQDAEENLCQNNYWPQQLYYLLSWLKSVIKYFVKVAIFRLKVIKYFWQFSAERYTLEKPVSDVEVNSGHEYEIKSLENVC